MNPYLPGQPITPESFAGRLELVGRVGEIVDDALSPLRRSAAILLHGHRGSGKTSAIRKIESVVQRRAAGAVHLEVQLLAASDDDTLLKLLLDNIRTQAGPSSARWNRVREFLGRVSAVTAPLGGVDFEGARATTPTTSQALWRNCLQALHGIPLLVVAVDDADYLDGEGLGRLKTIAESPSKLPIVLAVAGGPALLDRMAEAQLSPVARIFSGAKFNLGELSRAETDEALLVPAKAARSKTVWDESAKRRVFELSLGNPYLVQCFAFSAYAEGARIDGQAVDRSLEKALRVGEDWLARACAGASDEDIRAFYTIARTGRGSFQARDIASLKVSGSYVQRLARAGILRRVSRGHYDLAPAPVVAYYHALVRGLALG